MPQTKAALLLQRAHKGHQSDGAILSRRWRERGSTNQTGWREGEEVFSFIHRSVDLPLTFPVSFILYSLFSILYSLFFILYSLFFIPYSLFLILLLLLFLFHPSSFSLSFSFRFSLSFFSSSSSHETPRNEIQMCQTTMQTVQTNKNAAQTVVAGAGGTQ